VSFLQALIPFFMAMSIRDCVKNLNVPGKTLLVDFCLRLIGEMCPQEAAAKFGPVLEELIMDLHGFGEPFTRSGKSRIRNGIQRFILCRYSGVISSDKIWMEHPSMQPPARSLKTRR
jgi:hypothetical protein